MVEDKIQFIRKKKKDEIDFDTLGNDIKDIVKEVIRNPDKIADGFIMAGLAAIGYNSNLPFDAIGKIIYPMVAYKLATSLNLAAGAAGVAMLGGLGLSEIGTITEMIKDEIEKEVKEFKDNTIPADMTNPLNPTCPQGYHLVKYNFWFICKKDGT